ncbi:MAG TPA: lipoprotein signal peptidase [Acidiferrobacteraceae bacterium]|nr:lipoprotein signal peptidase [Acidiferrobacteraceae bacterium]
MLKLTWIAVVVLILDQTTKYIAVSALLGQPPMEIAPFFNFSLVYNTGAAFGFLNSASGWQNIFFVSVAIVVSVFILIYLKRLSRADIQVAIALLLVLGGALGNVTDRLMLGHVVDFVDLHYAGWHWPAFNVADSAIFIGAALLILDAFGIRWGGAGDSSGD